MSANGYIMVDFSGVDLLPAESKKKVKSGVTVTGLYSLVSDAISTGKPIIATGLSYGDGVDLTPIAATVYADKSGLNAIISIYVITISSADSVTITTLTGGDDPS